MYLHLGGNVSVKLSDIIGIFDLENTSVKKDTRLFLKKMQDNKRVINVSEDLPKSFCVCANGNNQSVYISQISPHTLNKRLDDFLKEY